jgi:hypothetical protein
VIQKLTTHGFVRGKLIEVSDDLGLSEGEQVEVTVTQLEERPAKPGWGEGLRRCAGALADSWTEADDRILEQIYLDRKTDTRPELKS